MYALFFTFNSGYSSAKNIEIGQELTRLQPSTHCHVLWITTKCIFATFACGHIEGNVDNFTTTACSIHLWLKWYENYNQICQYRCPANLHKWAWQQHRQLARDYSSYNTCKL